jgi:phosphoribosylformylglycinamidine synthase subunit PurSL
MIYRIDVRTAQDADSLGEAVRHQIQEFGITVGPISTSRIFLIDTDAAKSQVRKIADELLADAIVESAELIDKPQDESDASRIEIHLKPGVMDPVAASTEMAIRDMGLNVKEVRTGRAFVIHGSVPREQLQHIASRVLANGVIESVHFDRYIPAKFEAGREYQFQLKHVALRELTDAQLTKLSREGHLFLSLAEMKAIQSYFREQNREPTDIELETLAQTWSEHCVHKTLKSAVEVEVHDAAGKTIGHRRYGNLIKETIFKSTMELMDAAPGANPFCLSVFADNAGVIAFDEIDAVCFKVETHNHPSAIEPYGGSATGAGGVIRDILGTGLAAKPIANTDVFCVAYPDTSQLPRGVIHPKRVLQQVVAGVRDYGNRMGIPTVNGAVYFDNRYIGNPLVFCGCVGLIPRDKIFKRSNDGDAIVVMGGRTGRDGIHGATFSSAELTDTHADEFSHAVQIGNAITEKKVADVILQARDRNLFTAITDCGAGGLSSAVGEMGEKIGAVVELDRVPLKYAGLRYDEIWISEAQERMVMSVPQGKVVELLKLAGGEDVEATVIGVFGTPQRELVLNYRGSEVGRMGMKFMHDGIPMPARKAVVVERKNDDGRWKMEDGKSASAPSSIFHPPSSLSPGEFRQRLLNALAHPNIASKHWIIRQYDHEVQGGSVIKPLIGPQQIGPSDAAVVRPKLSSYRGMAIGCGLCPQVTDPYDMAIAAIDEAIRNIICVGSDYNRIAILDNFCWPSVDDEKTMGTLVRACEACYDAAKAFGIPFISGKDSLHNQFTNQETGEVIRIPPTLLISAIGIVEDVRKCVTMDLKTPGGKVMLVFANNPSDLKSLAATHRAMAQSIAAGEVVACHDISDGGVAVAAAEMCIASGMGMSVNDGMLKDQSAFGEMPGRYLVELREQHVISDFKRRFDTAAEVREFGTVRDDRGFAEIPLDDLVKAWRGTLDW